MGSHNSRTYLFAALLVSRTADRYGRKTVFGQHCSEDRQIESLQCRSFHHTEVGRFDIDVSVGGQFVAAMYFSALVDVELFYRLQF